MKSEGNACVRGMEVVTTTNLNQWDQNSKSMSWLVLMVSNWQNRIKRELRQSWWLEVTAAINGNRVNKEGVKSQDIEMS